MTEPLNLSPACNNCNSSAGELYGSFCTHMTLCRPCGKLMAENLTPCRSCGVPVTKLIQEYSVRSASSQKNYFVGRFSGAIPKFSKSDSASCKWMMHREGTQGKILSETAKEKSKSKPFILENDLDSTSYQGNMLGGQNSSFIFLKHGKDFLFVPLNSWYHFQKQANYKTLTLEEAEMVMKSRNKQAEGYSRWFMRKGKEEETEGDKDEKGERGGGKRGKKKEDEDDLGLDSDKEDEDAEGEEERKERLRMNKKDGRTEEIDLDGDLEKGDDWEHEETFTDDDEAVGNDKEEREENIEPEAPPPAINEEDEEEEEEDGEENESNKLSDYGKNLKKLLVKKEKEENDEDDDATGRGFDEGGEEEEDDFDDNELDINSSPVFFSKEKISIKDENVPAKSQTAVAKSDKKRKVATSDEVKPPSKKGKVSAATSAKEAPKEVPVRSLTEDSVKDILRKGPIKCNDLVFQFKEFVKTANGKSKFQEILKKVGKIKKINGNNFIILR